MSTMIHDRVKLAQAGDNPYVIAKMRSGWAVIGDVQPLQGYCLLLPDPVVPSINDLTTAQRLQYSEDMYFIGDLLLRHTDSHRINYEVLGNTEAAHHAHIIPRYQSEADGVRGRPAMCGYRWKESRKFDPKVDGELVAALRRGIEERA